jgi:hypothetical protein
MLHRQFLSPEERAQIDRLDARRKAMRAELRELTRAVRRLKTRGYQRGPGRRRGQGAGDRT